MGYMLENIVFNQFYWQATHWITGSQWTFFDGFASTKKKHDYIYALFRPQKKFAASRRFFQHEIDLCWRKVFKKAPQAIFFSFWTFKIRLFFIKSIIFPKIAYAFSKISIEISKMHMHFPKIHMHFLVRAEILANIYEKCIYIYEKKTHWHQGAPAHPAAQAPPAQVRNDLDWLEYPAQDQLSSI